MQTQNTSKIQIHMVRWIRSDIWKGGIALPNAITSGKHTHLHPYLQCRKEISWQKTNPPPKKKEKNDLMD